jgi:outer membrane receptor protein involved in Fe transport
VGRLTPILIALILSGISADAVFAREALEGRVVDERTKQPMARAEISILGRPGVAHTDADGRFTWTPSPAPPFEVLIVLPGERYLKPVLIEQLPETGVLEIAVEAVLQEFVAVTAGAAPDIEATAANATTLLSGREIQIRQPVHLTQALENVAGVSQVSEGQAAVPAVRGLARGRTLILIDGARVTSERRVGPSATYLDPFTLDGIEVARGPGSVGYGSDAFGGVIFARTRRVEPQSPWRGRFSGSAGGGIPELRGGAEISRGFDRGGILISGHYRDFDDYRSPRGDVFNSGATDYGGLVRGNVFVGKGLLNAGWQTDLGRDIDRPRNNSRTVRFYYPTEDSHRFTASYDVADVSGFSRVGVSGFVGSYAVVTDQDRFPTATSARSIERADVSANDYHVRGFAERLAGPARFELGVDANGRYDLHALDFNIAYDLDGAIASIRENVSVDSAHRNDVGAFATVDARLASRLTVAGGVRGDRVTTTNRGGFFGDRETSNGAFSGSASITADVAAGLTITGQIARGFRDPVLSDRYYRGPTGRGFITGNPDLAPETSRQLDLAVRYTNGRYRWGFYAYNYRIDDLIERYQTATDFFFFRNRGRAEIRGVELEMQATVAQDLTVEIAGSIARGNAVDDDQPLDDIAPETLTLVVRKAFGERAFAQVRGAAYARDDRPGPTEILVPGYALVDAAGGYRIMKQLELRASLRNMFDHAYPVSPDARAVPSPGISGLLTAAVTF